MGTKEMSFVLGGQKAIDFITEHQLAELFGPNGKKYVEQIAKVGPDDSDVHALLNRISREEGVQFKATLKRRFFDSERWVITKNEK